MSIFTQDWLRDNGIAVPMLMDRKRNRFYDAILKQTVSEKPCVDIGFGTGILSILALKHGARFVDAYECDAARYDMGQQIIRSLGLQNSIALHHEKFCQDQKVPAGTVVFHEIVDFSIWGEGLFGCLRRGSCFVPAKYSMTFMAAVDQDLDQQVALGMQTDLVQMIDTYQQNKGPDWPCISQAEQLRHLPQHIVEEIVNVHNLYHMLPWLDPALVRIDIGVDIDERWLNLYRNFVIGSCHRSWHCFRYPEWIDGKKLTQMVASAKTLAGYEVDATTTSATVSNVGHESVVVDLANVSELSVVIDGDGLPESNWFLLCWPELRHHHETLALASTDANAHWGMPYIFHISGQVDSLRVNTDLVTGAIRVC